MLEIAPDDVHSRRQSLADELGRYERMLEIRCTEDRIKELFAEGIVHGTTHTSQGQEAVAVGMASVLRVGDMVSCTYRGHGHALALGMTPRALLGEILGRVCGCVGGLGGSMHLSDRRIGLLPTTAIVGAGVPMAAGAAWAARLRGTDDVAVGVFGDGATNIGAFHEGMNLAAVWRLPVVFVCENNLYGEYSPIGSTTAVPAIADRAAAYAMPAEAVDGQDLEAVRAATERAVSRARSGDGPTLLEMKTYRYSGHSRSDPASYRPPGELDAWLARDPLAIERARLIERGRPAEELDELEAAVRSAVEQDIDAAKASPFPDVSTMFEHITATPSRGES